MSGSVRAVIAAAGLSSRMGKFKPLLPFDGSTVIRRCAEHLADAGAEEIVVVTGFRGEEIVAELCGLNVRIVENSNYIATQMFDSLKLGLETLTDDCEKILLTPGDVPWVSPELIRSLLHVDADFVCPTCGEKRGHPVVLAGKYISSLLQYNGDGGLRGAIEVLGLSTTFVRTEEIGVTIDLDTPEDYRRITELKEKAGLSY